MITKALGGILILSMVAGLSFSPPVDARTRREVVLDCDKFRNVDLIALACNIYHEARSESKPGQWLVALATRNRLHSSLYPDTWAEVVWEKRVDKRTGKWVPMFSWTRDGEPDYIYNRDKWATAVQIAARLIAEEFAGLHPAAAGTANPRITPDITFGCMWYHHVDIMPYWASSYYPTVRVQNHQCYAADEDAYLAAMQHLMPAVAVNRETLALTDDTIEEAGGE